MSPVSEGIDLIVPAPPRADALSKTGLKLLCYRKPLVGVNNAGSVQCQNPAS